MQGESKFNFRNRVIIDGDASLVAVVTGFFFREGCLLIEVSWIDDGKSSYERIEDWRLGPA